MTLAQATHILLVMLAVSLGLLLVAAICEAGKATIRYFNTKKALKPHPIGDKA